MSAEYISQAPYRSIGVRRLENKVDEIMTGGKNVSNRHDPPG